MVLFDGIKKCLISLCEVVDQEKRTNKLENDSTHIFVNIISLQFLQFTYHP